VYAQLAGFATLLRIVKEMILPYNLNMVKASLLFVEADIDVSNMTIIYFAGMGWDVYPAASGSDALKGAIQVLPHLILLDLILPDMDGLEVFRALRTNKRTAHIPVIFLTDNKKAEKGEDHLPLGAIHELASNADDYVAKPVDIEELKLRAQGALRRSERQNLIDPRSRLPTGRLIEDELQHIIRQAGWSRLDAHINKFEPFKDVYGMEAGDDVLRFTAMLIGEVIDELGTTSDFIGHAGADNFIIITRQEKADAIKARLKARFNREILAYYDATDGRTSKAPLMTLSIGIASLNL
jgi:DNA-binding response OmpR family regulator